MVDESTFCVSLMSLQTVKRLGRASQHAVEFDQTILAM